MARSTDRSASTMSCDELGESTDHIEKCIKYSQLENPPACRTWWARLFGLTKICPEYLSSMEGLHTPPAPRVFLRSPGVTTTSTIIEAQTTAPAVTHTETLTSTIWNAMKKDKTTPTVLTETSTTTVWKTSSITQKAAHPSHLMGTTTITVPVRYTPSLAGIWNTNWQQVIDDNFAGQIDQSTAFRYNLLVTAILYFLLKGLVREAVDWLLIFFGEDSLLSYRVLWWHFRGRPDDTGAEIADEEDSEDEDDNEGVVAGDRKDNVFVMDEAVDEMLRGSAKMLEKVREEIVHIELPPVEVPFTPVDDQTNDELEWITDTERENQNIQKPILEAEHDCEKEDRKSEEISAELKNNREKSTGVKAEEEESSEHVASRPDSMERGRKKYKNVGALDWVKPLNVRNGGFKVTSDKIVRRREQEPKPVNFNAVNVNVKPKPSDHTAAPMGSILSREFLVATPEQMEFSAGAKDLAKGLDEVENDDDLNVTF